ncbi:MULTISPECIES: hypothetical protein [Kytococcus]|uniref:hypothetical protein n=1 Tax=Kytococcus TaxID=57499 RepID=UPI0008A3012C|nr:MULTISPECIES: hypothetical protein [Kytococcus]OFS15794.1 hypothetical protein HMPREF3099_01140 [Kytococcus sp. HMSC28H12]
MTRPALGRRSVWRLPWRMRTGTWMADCMDLAGGAPTGSDPISGTLGCLMLLPAALLFPFWLVEFVLELVLWPFVVAGRAVQRLWAG